MSLFTTQMMTLAQVVKTSVLLRTTLTWKIRPNYYMLRLRFKPFIGLNISWGKNKMYNFETGIFFVGRLSPMEPGLHRKMQTLSLKQWSIYLGGE